MAELLPGHAEVAGTAEGEMLLALLLQRKRTRELHEDRGAGDAAESEAAERSAWLRRRTEQGVAWAAAEAGGGKGGVEWRNGGWAVLRGRGREEEEEEHEEHAAAEVMRAMDRAEGREGRHEAADSADEPEPPARAGGAPKGTPRRRRVLRAALERTHRREHGEKRARDDDDRSVELEDVGAEMEGKRARKELLQEEVEEEERRLRRAQQGESSSVGDEGSSPARVADTAPASPEGAARALTEEGRRGGGGGADEEWKERMRSLPHETLVTLVRGLVRTLRTSRDEVGTLRAENERLRSQNDELRNAVGLEGGREARLVDTVRTLSEANIQLEAELRILRAAIRAKDMDRDLPSVPRWGETH